MVRVYLLLISLICVFSQDTVPLDKENKFSKNTHGDVPKDVPPKGTIPSENSAIIEETAAPTAPSKPLQQESSDSDIPTDDTVDSLANIETTKQISEPAVLEQPKPSTMTDEERARKAEEAADAIAAAFDRVAKLQEEERKMKAVAEERVVDESDSDSVVAETVAETGSVVDEPVAIETDTNTEDQVVIEIESIETETETSEATKATEATKPETEASDAESVESITLEPETIIRGIGGAFDVRARIFNQEETEEEEEQIETITIENDISVEAVEPLVDADIAEENEHSKEPAMESIPTEEATVEAATVEEANTEEANTGEATIKATIEEEATTGEATTGEATIKATIEEDATTRKATTGDASPDAAQDAAPDATPDAAPDATPDTAPDATPNATPDTQQTESVQEMNEASQTVEVTAEGKIIEKTEEQVPQVKQDITPKDNSQHIESNTPTALNARSTQHNSGILFRGVSYLYSSGNKTIAYVLSLVSHATTSSSFTFLETFRKCRHWIFQDVLRAGFTFGWRRLLRIRWVTKTTDVLWSRFGIDSVDVTVLFCSGVVLLFYFLRWIVGANRRSLSSSAIMVTSAAGPIGLKVVQQLVERSDVGHVFACCAGQDDSSELELMGSSVQIITLDPKDPKTIDNAFVEVSIKVKELGMTFDGVVVVCASVPLIGPVHHLKAVRLKNQFEVNTVGLVSVVQKFLPLLRSDLREDSNNKKSGRIVCCFGPGSSMPGAFASAPSATKAATLALMDALRQELRPTGVDCISIQPVLDVFSPYLGNRGYSLANQLNREIKKKDPIFGVFFERFLERHQTTSATEGNSFVETEVPLLLPTANATLMALQTYPAPCSIMVSGMTTRYWDRCIRCKTKKEQHESAMQATMRPIAFDYMSEYGCCSWATNGIYNMIWWCVVLLIGSFLVV